MIRNLWPIWVIFFMFSFVTSSKLIIFYCVIILLHLISSFSLTRSLNVPYIYVSIKSIYYILLSSFERKAVLLISSVKTLCLSLLNLCCAFNINLLFFMNSLISFLRLSMSISSFSTWFILFSR